MFLHVQHETGKKASEAGFALIMAMVALLVLTLLGIWALNTSTFELKVAGVSQTVEKQFNVAEGGACIEAMNVASITQIKPFFDYANRNFMPKTDAQFDPGNDTANILADIDPTDSTTWPWDNLRNATSAAGQAADANEFDYRYLITCSDCPSDTQLGEDATSEWKKTCCRVQGAAPLVVELGIKISSQTPSFE